MIQCYPGEKIIFETRRHWYVLFIESFFIFVFAVAPFIFYPFFISTDIFLKNAHASVLYLFFACLWLLLLWIVFFVTWTNYYLDVWVVTNRRIVSVEQHSLFFREIAECRLDRVQDVTVEVKGLLATLLKFGNVYLQTAGTAREFVMSHVPHPEYIKKVIFNELENFSNIKDNIEENNSL